MPNYTKLHQIIDVLHKHSDAFQNTYNIKNLGIFGSVARNEANDTSDIDVLIEFSKPLGFFRFIQTEDFLTRLLKRKVDLVTEKALKPIIKQQILREVIYV